MKEIRMKLIPYEKLKNDLDGVFSEIEKGSIVIVDAKLTPEEEARIIEETMNRVSLKFKGIEISSFQLSGGADGRSGMFSILKKKLEGLLSGKERGITLIGSASIIKKIERNPQELAFYI